MVRVEGAGQDSGCGGGRLDMATILLVSVPFGMEGRGKIIGCGLIGRTNQSPLETVHSQFQLCIH